MGSSFVVANEVGVSLDYIDKSGPKYTEWDDLLSQLSSNIQDNKFAPQSYFISLNVTRWSQSDSQWGTDKMGGTCGNTTMSAEGCAVTAVAMVFDYFGANTDPGKLNKDLGSHSCPIYWGTAANLYSQVGGYGINTSPSKLDVINASFLSLHNDIPIVIGYTKPNGGTHFVTVTGLYNDGDKLSDIRANDPAGGVYRYLNYYENLGWTPHRIVIYSPGYN